ncbi:hypothetical protein HX747_25350 [Streptomyces sp. L06]|nr:hypothetical protein [Streptomyces sp. L06]
MPSIDLARRRLRLSDAHISVLGILVDEGQIPEDHAQAHRELREAALLDTDDKIVADLYPLVSTLMAPRVIAQAEVTGPLGTTLNGAVVGDDFLFTHERWPGEAESEYVPVEPETLVWALARMVDLHRETVGDEAEQVPAEEITSTMGTLDALLVLMEEGRAQEPEAAAAASSAPVRLAEVLAQLNTMWRLTVVWQDAAGSGGPGARALAVWDCGVEGYWVRELPAEPVAEGEVAPATTLKARRSSPREIWSLITGLLPEADELRAPAPAEGS